MTFGEGRALFLRYLDEATCGGSPPAPGQIADLCDRYASLAGPAQLYLAAFRPLWARILMQGPDRPAIHAGLCELGLPEDFASMGGVENAFGAVPWGLAPGAVLVPQSCGFPVEIRYLRRPAALPPDTPDDTPFELAEDIAPLIPLCAAVEATAAGDPATAAALRALLEEKLGNLSRAVPRQGGIRALYSA